MISLFHPWETINLCVNSVKHIFLYYKHPKKRKWERGVEYDDDSDDVDDMIMITIIHSTKQQRQLTNAKKVTLPTTKTRQRPTKPR